MKRVILDQEVLGLSLLFEKATGARVVDCFQDKEIIFFVVAKGEMGKALGKKAVNLKRMQDELGKRVKLIEYDDDLISYVRKVIYPLQVEEILADEQTVTLKDRNKKTKSLLIGREGRNLQFIKRAVKRFFNVDVRVN